MSMCVHRKNNTMNNSIFFKNLNININHALNTTLYNNKRIVNVMCLAEDSLVYTCSIN